MYESRKFEGSLEFARQLDSKDEMEKFRDRFYINEGKSLWMETH